MGRIVSLVIIRITVVNEAVLLLLQNRKRRKAGQSTLLLILLITIILCKKGRNLRNERNRVCGRIKRRDGGINRHKIKGCIDDYVDMY